MSFRTIRNSLLAVSLLALPYQGAFAQSQINSAESSAVAADSVITLRSALARVMDANPTLLGQKFSLSAASARRDQAALRPAFQVGVDVEDIFGTDRVSTFGQSQITLQLSTVIELGGKRGSRISTAERERDLLLTELDGQRLDVIAEVARRFIGIVAAQRELSLAEQSVALATETRKAVARRVNAGAGNIAEQRNAEIAETRAEIERSRAESGVIQARTSLAAMWGGGYVTNVDAAAELFATYPLQSIEELTTQMDQSPNILRFASERRVGEARVRLAETQAIPDITVGAGVRRIQEVRSNAFLLNFSMPLGTGSRAAPYTSEARSNLAAVDYKERAARAELTATLTAFYQEAVQREKELTQLRERAVPLAESSRELTQNGYNAGRFSLLELLTAQQQLITLQRAAIEAAVAYHNALIEIERLTARPVITQPAS